MKRLILTLCLAMTTTAASAAVVGSWNIGQTSGHMMRDLKNGQWRGGENVGLWKLSLNNQELIHIGISHTYNAEHGNPALGPSIGKSVKIGDIGSGMINVFGGQDTSMPGWLRYLGNVTSVEADAAYMPVHTKDVNGPFIWGVGFNVDLSDLLSILRTGI